MTFADEVAAVLGDRAQAVVPLGILRERVTAHPGYSPERLFTEVIASNVDILRQSGVLAQQYNLRALWLWRPALFE